ncbi:MFS transporter [Xanthobacter tagetidis]|uniref:MFS transporter n=1 Tax=Xanthobacter tagetidis TaxID=60216 RepID=A0A3L7AF84_9HYPH|nr:MFS transporter [Xanthobacter tagetidis]MBB6308581.1 MFS family permease/quinol monooxygenase YgiN [Xanthobacter tagetidis]RLP78654.1 MFS transporter [Xanthobacter tagetidis]
MTAPQPTGSAGASGPLSFPVFRALWIATIISNVGTWMHDVGAGWLMTSLSPSPLLVALVQAATTLPMFLLALPAGAMADIVDRRKMLLAAQTLSLVAAALLALLTLQRLTTPEVLLAATFVLGIAAALSAPVFQAIVPELVNKQALPDAIALNSLGVNISRAIGPALGGVIVALAGTPAVFALNAVSVLAVLYVLVTWKRPETAHALPPEHFFGALKAGYRYTRHSPAMRLVLIRAAGFFLFGSALWAMLPLVARRGLLLDAAGYGALLGCMGAGAVVGALLLKRLRKAVSANTISVGATLLFALATLALSLVPNAWIAGAVMFAAGLAWIGMLTALNVAAQMASAGWVKARALAVYLLVFQGALTGGSILWGTLASNAGVATALAVAAIGQAAALVLAFRWRLPQDQAMDLAPSNHWAEPVVSVQPEDDRGPVLIEIEYRVEPARLAEFVAALRRFRSVRQRDGAIRWDVWEDVAEPGRVVEAFIVESWLEHQRQHARTTRTDQLDQDVLRAFHLGDGPPAVRHMLKPL